jgi:hypothetical protein
MVPTYRQPKNRTLITTNIYEGKNRVSGRWMKYLPWLRRFAGHWWLVDGEKFFGLKHIFLDLFGLCFKI